jgi:hypothetical protein
MGTRRPRKGWKGVGREAGAGWGTSGAAAPGESEGKALGREGRGCRGRVAMEGGSRGRHMGK